jgi:hypothetical protein
VDEVVGSDELADEDDDVDADVDVDVDVDEVEFLRAIPLLVVCFVWSQTSSVWKVVV